MRIPETQIAAECFEQRDAFLRACLGLVRMLDRFDALLKRSAPLRARVDAISRDDQSYQLVLAMLGAVALGQRLRVHLGNAVAARAAPQASARQQQDPHRAESLLR